MNEYGVRHIRKVNPGDPIPEPGEWVQLRCPKCHWVSPPSLVIDQVNGAWHAFQASSSMFHAHYREAHPIAPERWVVTEPHAEVDR